MCMNINRNVVRPCGHQGLTTSFVPAFHNKKNEFKVPKEIVQKRMEHRKVIDSKVIRT